jgi:DNA-binding protein HU-beta
MADSLNGIINQLERQKTAIDRALAALQGIEGIPAPGVGAPASTPATRKGGMTPAGRRRLSAALKKRWAAKKAAEVEPAATLEVPARKGKKRSAAVRKRMKEAQRLRWAKIRGESEAAPAIPEPSKPKSRISAEGMKRIIAATKKRWRLQKAAAKSAPVKSAGKKAAVKKSAPVPALSLAHTAG